MVIHWIKLMFLWMLRVREEESSDDYSEEGSDWEGEEDDSGEYC